MSVQLQEFRVVGVNCETGQDVSVVIEAGTKAAAEVKAEQMNIETTHIVRIKQDEPTPPDEHELFSTEAAEALAGKRTDKLIEEVVPPEEPKATPEPPTSKVAPAAPRHAAKPTQSSIATTITRPIHNTPSMQRDASVSELSGFRAFSFVLVVLLAMAGGAYFVLVHEPNAVEAQEHELVFGEDLFSDVLPPQSDARKRSNTTMRDAFSNRSEPSATEAPPIAIEQQRFINHPPQQQPDQLQLQSVVTSHEGRFAVINGKLYKQGTTLMGYTLVNVADDWVLIEKEGQQSVLQIESTSP